MTYDNYAAKIKKRADRLHRAEKWAGRHKILLIAAALVMLAAFAALSYFSGVFTSELDVRRTVYGAEPDVSASAFLSGVEYEYTALGEPVKHLTAGEYSVRAYTENIYGVERELTAQLTVEKRPVSVGFLTKEFEYGYEPDVSLLYAEGLAEGDRIVSAEFDHPGAVGEKISVSGLRIENAAGTDVTDSYNVSYDDGEMTVIPKKITVTTPSASRRYDGTELHADEYSLSCEPAYNDRVTVTFGKGITDVGSVINMPQVSFTDENGNDVTHYYKIKRDPGTLTVNRRPLSVSTNDITEEYARKYYKDTTVTVTAGSLVPGHKLTAYDFKSFFKAQKADNDAELRIFDENGEDKTYDYDILFSPGLVVIEKRELKIKTASGEFLYDGKYHSVEKAEIVEGAPVEGDVFVEFRNFTSNFYAGEYQNTCACYIISGLTGDDVSQNYKLTFEPGTVEITRRHIKVLAEITSYSPSSKKFNTKATVTYGSLAEGDYLKIDQIDFNFPFEEIADHINVHVFGRYSDTERTDCYDIEIELDYDMSKFTGITPDTGTAETGGVGTGSGDDTQQSGSETGGAQHGEDPPEDKPEDGVSGVVPRGSFTVPKGGVDSGMVASMYAGSLYLRLESRGKYENGAWQDAVPYKEEGESRLTSAYRALLENRFTAYNEVIVNFSGKTMPSPYYSALSESKDYGDMKYIDDLYVSGITELCYFDHVPSPELQVILKLDPADIGDDDYYEFVCQNYLDVPDDVKSVLQSLADENGINANDRDLIIKIRDFIRNAAEYNYAFGTIPDGEDPIVCFLTESKQGVCAHFASAGTLMYRLFGIPARYTYGYKVTTEGNYKPVGFSARQLHSWVEIYLKGIGWIAVEVTNSNMNADISNIPNEYMDPSLLDPELLYDLILIKITEKSKKYDGEPIIADEFEVYGEKILKEGQKIAFSEIKQRTYVGKTYVPSDLVRIYDESGGDVTGQYRVVGQSGYIIVSERRIKAELRDLYVKQTAEMPDVYGFMDEGSKELVKDAECVMSPVSKNSGITLDGSRITALFPCTVMFTYSFDAGKEEDGISNSAEVYVDVTVTAREFQNITISYGDPSELEGEAGIETVIECEDGQFRYFLALKTRDAEKVFDGKYLTGDGYEILCGAAAQGHTLDITTVSSILYTGETRNDFGKVTVTDEYGNDVTDEYVIVLYPGTLKITPNGYNVRQNEITLAVDETLDLSYLSWTDSVSGVYAKYAVKGDGTVARIENGYSLLGLKEGDTRLYVKVNGLDLNGDGVYEYSESLLEAAVTVVPKETNLPEYIIPLIIVGAGAVGVIIFAVTSLLTAGKGKENDAGETEEEV